jgi:large subunit ribosomal protein L32
LQAGTFFKVWFLICEITKLLNCKISRGLLQTMPNPKRRHSQKRTSTRRAHDALSKHSLSECPNCHEKKMPHRACVKCGYYKGREVLEVKEAS